MSLSGGYLFSTLAVVVHALVFPGVFAPHGALGAGAQSATWFWVWWHGGFPLFVIAYAVAHRRRDVGERVVSTSRGTIASAAAIVLGVATLATVTIWKEAWLPTIIQRGNYGPLITTGIGPLVGLSIVCGIASVIWFTRLRTITDLWLAVALFSSLLDVTLTLFGGGRYTLRWYVARGESLFASTVVLLTYLGAIDRILARLARLSRVDGLTGLANRRAFDDELAAHVLLSRRTQRPISLLMLDVDWFKRFNDAYGHARGDDALRAVAGSIAASLVRRSDLGARYGGEEFAIVLPATDAAGAAIVAERIRATIHALAHRDSPLGVVTASIGAATLDPLELVERVEIVTLLARADAALYAAKDARRNRVRASEDRMLPRAVARGVEEGFIERAGARR